MLKILDKFPLIKQIATYGAVGLSVTFVYILIHKLFFDYFQMTALNAHIITFILTLPISYLGHANFTFSEKKEQFEKNKRAVQTKFVITALLSFSLNSFFSYYLIDTLRLDINYYRFCIIFITPLFVFTTLKLIVFK